MFRRGSDFTVFHHRRRFGVFECYLHGIISYGYYLVTDLTHSAETLMLTVVPVDAFPERLV